METDDPKTVMVMETKQWTVQIYLAGLPLPRPVVVGDARLKT